MKVVNLQATIFVCTTMAACTTTENAAGFDQITSRQEFSAVVVGKTLIASGARMIVRADGSVTGTAPRGKVNLKWKWEGSLFCRSGTVGSETLAYDCQKIFIKGKTMHLVRNRGFGDAVDYRIH